MLTSILSEYFYLSAAASSIPVAVSGNLDNKKEINVVFYTDDIPNTMRMLLEFLEINGQVPHCLNAENIIMVNLEQGKFYVQFKKVEDISEIPVETIIDSKDIDLHDKEMLFFKAAKGKGIVPVTKEECIKNLQRWRKSKKRSSQKLPIPEHLKGILIPDSGGSSNQVTGSLCCDCKNNVFNVESLEDLEVTHIEAKCEKCKKSHVIFDSSIHGWDGFVCHVFSKKKECVFNLKEFQCEKCGQSEFKININILSQGPDDFASELEDEIRCRKFRKKDWVNAFEWITISLTCNHCDAVYDNFLDYEAM